MQSLRIPLPVFAVSSGDSSLLFGEISGSALAGIEAALSRFLKPLLSESDGWGKADTEQKVENVCLSVRLSRRAHHKGSTPSRCQRILLQAPLSHTQLRKACV